MGGKVVGRSGWSHLVSTTLLVSSLLVVALGLAGCTSEPAAPKSTANPRAPPPQAPEAKVTAETGSIHGLVTDDQLVAISSVEVGILELDLLTLTDLEGKFTLNDLKPGVYGLSAAKIGYTSRTVTVDVKAGEVSELAVRIVPLAAEVPHYTTDVQNGILKCSIRFYPAAPLWLIIGINVTGIAVCGVAPGVTGDKFLLRYEFEVGAWESYLEMRWQSAQVTGKGLSTVYEVDGQPNVRNATYGRMDGVSPLMIYADQAKMDWVATNWSTADCRQLECKVWTRTFASANFTNINDPQKVDVGIVVDQRFEQQMTAFYFMTKPEGFTALV